MTLLPLEKVYDAKKVLSEIARRTDIIHSNYLSEKNNVYLKTENLQLTGSFKLRGAYYKISKLTDEQKAKGIIACSAGNHAQGVALAAKKNNIKATIFIPATAPISKVEATRSYGADIKLIDGVYDDAYREAVKFQKETGGTFIHPFDDLDVATGQGTIAMEIIKELPLVDIILVPVGGGGLATGVSTLMKMLRPNAKVYAVEPEGAACLKASLEAGEVVTLPQINTIADGTAVKTPGTQIFPYLQKNLDGVITVPDSDLVVSFLDMVENHKMIVENSGLLTVAALKQLDCKGKKVVSILSGGNMDVITMSSVVQQGLIMRDRIFTVSVLLPDKPGELHRVSGIIAEVGGNVIKLEHNQFVSINRNAAVELRITLEAFGTEHKNQIIKALSDAGYAVRQAAVSI